VQEHQCNRQTALSGNPMGPTAPSSTPHESPTSSDGTARDRSRKTKSRRIIFRVTEELYEALMTRCRDQGCGLSDLLRNALNGSLSAETGPTTPSKPLLRPDELDSLVDHYRAIVDKDIRHERKRLFGHLLAASYVAKTNFPRTPGMVDGYQGLLALKHLFGYDENV
jgi:hypothetical protein